MLRLPMILIIGQKLHLTILHFKNCLIDVTIIVKNSGKKYVYSGYGIAFDGLRVWSFDHPPPPLHISRRNYLIPI